MCISVLEEAGSQSNFCWPVFFLSDYYYLHVNALLYPLKY